MNIFDVFKNGEIDELPEDSREAFVQFVLRAQTVLNERVEQAVAEDSENGWRHAEEDRHSFMSMVIAAAKRFEIGEFSSKAVPLLQHWGYDQFKEFRAELDHYLTQIVLDNSIRGKREGIAIPPKAKDRIRSHIHALKKLIDEANLEDARKASLLAKLERFEQELDKRRLPLAAIGLFTLELMALPGGIWQSADIAQKLMHTIAHEIHEAKVADDEHRQLPPTTEPARISPPRSAPAFESGGMDDDIPF